MPTTHSPNPINPLRKVTSKSSKALVAATIAIVVAAAAGIFSGLIWEQYNNIDKRVANTQQQLKKQMDDSRLQLQASVELVKAQTQQMQQNLIAVQQNLAHVLKITTKTSTQRALGDVTYLIHLANLHLTVGHNPETALQLLQIAYQRLQKIPNPAVFALKQALIHDIAVLKLVPKVNVSSLILELDQVSQALQNLPGLPSKKLPKVSTALTQHEHDNLPWYKKITHGLSGLKSLVIIRHIQKPIQPLLSPEQQNFLIENIQLKISQAEWAVLHQDPKLYKQSLYIAQQWLKTYYKDQTAAVPILSKLNELATINIKPKLPNISDSINALSQNIVTPATTTKKTIKKKIIKNPASPTKQPEAKQ